MIQTAKTTAHNHHASAVAFGPRGGVLIFGASGSGKSHLALAMVHEGAQLVADDQVLLTAKHDALFARAPQTTAGLIEARGIGLLRMAHRRLAQIALVVDLSAPRGPRMPDPTLRDVAGVSLPFLHGEVGGPFAAAISHYITRFIKSE